MLTAVEFRLNILSRSDVAYKSCTEKNVSSDSGTKAWNRWGILHTPGRFRTWSNNRI